MEKSNTKTQRVYIRVTPKVKKELQERAEAAHMDLSRFLIKSALMKRIITITDLPLVIVEISKIGVNINQIAKIANTQKYVKREELEAMTVQLRRVEDLVEQLMHSIFEQEPEPPFVQTNPFSVKNRLDNIETLLYQLIDKNENFGDNNGDC
ncbi:MAG: MobC family plasmid mobilization relaxosome protein [Acutalibacteraceae bacterium]